MNALKTKLALALTITFVAAGATAEEMVAWRELPALQSLPGGAAVEIKKVDSTVEAALLSQGYRLEPNAKFELFGELSPSEEIAASPNWVAEAIRLPDAHRLSDTKGDGVRVCVLDTGIDASHADLRGKIREQISLIQDEAADDALGHGTHVSSLIVGKPAYGASAPEATLIMIKVFSNKGNGGGDLATIAQGLQTCISRRVDVISLSLGTTKKSQLLESLMEKAQKAGITVVAAAGNSGPSSPVAFPAAYDGVIAVGAVNERLEISQFSSRGPEMKFVAPGVKVKGARSGGGYVEMSGTSMAAPIVAGVVASMKSRRSPRLAAQDLGYASEIQGAGLIDAAGTALEQ